MIYNLAARCKPHSLSQLAARTVYVTGIVASRDDFGLRWQSEAATPLSHVRAA